MTDPTDTNNTGTNSASDTHTADRRTPDQASPATLTEDARIEAARDEDLGGFDDDDILRVRNYDTVTQIMAASLGATVPGALDGARATMLLTMERHGLFSLSNGGGTLEDYFREMFAIPADKQGQDGDDETGWEGYVEIAERRREERREWEASHHEFAGVEMTGQEWGEFADNLSKDTPLRQWLVDRIKARGKTEAEAKKEADQAALLARMQSMPKSQWTDEMKQLDAQMQADPQLANTLREDLRDANDIRGRTPKPATEQEKVMMKGSSQVSVGTGADVLGGGIQQDIILTDEHRRAVAATEPLDSPPPPKNDPKPQQLAMATPVPAPGSGGLDI